jgi:hypothetical protein
MKDHAGRKMPEARLTGLLPASPVRKGGVKGSYTKMAIFLTGCVSPRSEPPPGRAGRLHFGQQSGIGHHMVDIGDGSL